MKKTEKIEVRLSETEKAAFSRLADIQGRTISEMIRTLANAHLDEHDRKQAALIKDNSMSKRQKVTYILGGLAGGVVALLALQTVQGHAAKPMLLTVEIERGEGYYSLTTALVAKKGVVETVRLPINKTEAYIISTNFSDIQKTTALASFDICLSKGDVCESLAAPSFYVDFGSHTGVEFGAEQGEQIGLSITPDA